MILWLGSVRQSRIAYGTCLLRICGSTLDRRRDILPGQRLSRRHGPTLWRRLFTITSESCVRIIWCHQMISFAPSYPRAFQAEELRMEGRWHDACSVTLMVIDYLPLLSYGHDPSPLSMAIIVLVLVLLFLRPFLTGIAFRIDGRDFKLVMATSSWSNQSTSPGSRWQSRLSGVLHRSDTVNAVLKAIHYIDDCTSQGWSGVSSKPVREWLELTLHSNRLYEALDS